jgi:hypothetical protein
MSKFASKANCLSWLKTEKGQEWLKSMGVKNK